MGFIFSEPPPAAGCKPDIYFKLTSWEKSYELSSPRLAEKLSEKS